MYPTLFEVPFLGFPVSTFGLMMAVGFLAGTWLFARRLRELGRDPDLATTFLVYAMIGGVLGSKLYFAVDVWLREGQPFLSLLLSRDGITWFGGLMGGFLFVMLGSRLHGVPFREVANNLAPSAALGQAIGRIGCFLVGDDYGRATELPWGVAFPQGAPPVFEPVHPTQLYEFVWLGAVAGLLWRRRDRSPFLLGEYFVLAGAGRFVIEFWRVNEPIAGLTEPQWIGLALVAVGALGWLHQQRRVAPGDRPGRAAA